MTVIIKAGVPVLITNVRGLTFLFALVLTGYVAVFVIPAVSLFLVLFAKRGYRRATLYQLRWVVITAGVAAGLVAATGLSLIGMGHFLKSLRQPSAGIAALILATLVIVLGFWLFKGIYLAATYFFRADDAHPLLAPISTIPIAWAASYFIYTHGSSWVGNRPVSDVPKTLGIITTFGGAASITIISVITLIRLRNKPQWPFRTGPVQSRAAAWPARASFR